jgi:hypothetical protein
MEEGKMRGIENNGTGNCNETENEKDGLNSIEDKTTTGEDQDRLNLHLHLHLHPHLRLRKSIPIEESDE